MFFVSFFFFLREVAVSFVRGFFLAIMLGCAAFCALLGSSTSCLWSSFGPPTASRHWTAPVYCGCKPGPTGVLPMPRQSGIGRRAPALQATLTTTCYELQFRGDGGYRLVALQIKMVFSVNGEVSFKTLIFLFFFCMFSLRVFFCKELRFFFCKGFFFCKFFSQGMCFFMLCFFGRRVCFFFFKKKGFCFQGV